MRSPRWRKEVERILITEQQIARRIRTAVNGNDMFKRWIQFNTAAGLAVGGAAAGVNSGNSD